MRYFFFAMAITMIIGISTAYSAEFRDEDYPYTIYFDDGLIRYCMEPEVEDTHRSCYSNGVETMCEILPADEGYIDCNQQIDDNVIDNYHVIDYGQATRIITKNDVSFMCLLTYEGLGFTGSYKWVGLTCARMGVEPLAWQFCKGISGKPILQCSPPTKEADPGSESKIRMKAG